ncbi:hypothetical protein M3J07_008936 [Ascochyta lentis]
MAVGTGAHLRDVKCEDQMALMTSPVRDYTC